MKAKNPLRQFTSHYEERYKRGTFVKADAIKRFARECATLPPFVDGTDVAAISLRAAGLCTDKATGEEYEYVSMVVYAKRRPA